MKGRKKKLKKSIVQLWFWGGWRKGLDKGDDGATEVEAHQVLPPSHPTNGSG